MLSFFRRGGQNTPTIAEPAQLPPPSARREKEQRWLASISSKDKPASPHTFSSAQAQAQTQAPLTLPAATTRGLSATSSSVSLRSTGTTKSRRSFFGRASRTKSSPQLAGLAQDGIDSSPRSRLPPPLPSSSTPTLLSHRTTRVSNVPHVPPSTPASAPSSAPSPTTASLASRLQELAVSHSDGLLNDEEYRALRTGLFERYASGGGEGPVSLSQGTEEVPRLHRQQGQSFLFLPQPFPIPALLPLSLCERKADGGRKRARAASWELTPRFPTSQVPP